MPKTQALAEDDVLSALRAMEADIQAALALNRATLKAIAALSPMLHAAAETAVEEEAGRAAPQRTIDILEDVLVRLQRAPEEALMVEALQLALVSAADALPSTLAGSRAARLA